ncbi:hypothetical protein [Bacillus sp. V5-8f]|uniref:hypothetical protein n=1 Tax=Bacillus sp. V5-8f TaxID=2053044 RepID=UPI000C763C96|nr:hypothetical protein [Bacillus sp. V5-8f]PLT33723.1 hypothetical protein CUU64_11440 [Bacillus sp. V5-8f]
MELIKWSYSRRNEVKASFDSHPNSSVRFRRIKNYFTYSADWSLADPIITGADMEEMELLLNRALGFETAYINKKQKYQNQSKNGK